MKSFTLFPILLAAAIGQAQNSCPPPPELKAIMAWPAGTIIPGIGSTDLPITTKSEKARQLTKQGFALIHCFWFNEAIRSFRDATKEDPACAAAWLGVNVSLTLPWYTPGEEKAEADYAIQRAVQTCGDATDIEQAVIAAYRARSMNTSDPEGELETSMMRVIADHPEANEPRLLIAGNLTQRCMHSYDEKLDPQKELAKVFALIQPVLKRDPNNAGALHYRIHALEGSRPDEAVNAADRLTKSAPASGHMVHMPGHIYYRVGNYEKARESFLNSVRIHEDYAKTIPGATPFVDWNYSHDLDYLIFNLAEMGKLKEGEEYLKKNPGSRQKLEWRTAAWDMLAQHSNTPYFLGMAAIARGDLAAAVVQADKLDASAAKTRAAAPSKWSLTGDRMELARADELRGLLLSRQGRHDEARTKLASSVASYKLIAYEEPPYYSRPPFETQGEVELAAGHPEDALKAYQEGLKDRPNSGWMLYGIALSYEKAGRTKDARKAYQDFLKAWATADQDLPQVIAAKAFLARS